MREEFDKNGYVVLKNFFIPDLLEDFKEAYRELIRSYIRKASLTGLVEPSYATGNEFDDGMMKLESIDHKYVAEIYDASAQMPEFLRIVSDPDLSYVARTLLDCSCLYGFTNRCRIDMPHDERRTYGWHQEVFYTLPKSEFIQTWFPLIRDTTIQNGTIHICEGSHKEGIAKQTWTDIEGRATQIIVDDEIVAKYPQKQIEMKLGDLLVFSGKTFHKSGKNTSEEVRYSMVGMFHNAEFPTFEPPSISFKYRGVSQKEYYDSVFRASSGLVTSPSERT